LANTLNNDEKDPENRFRDRTARIGVIGLGYVGLPLAEAFALAGFSVTGFDIDGDKVRQLNEGRTYIRHISDARIGAIVGSGKFRASADYADIGDMEAILICVPTPLTRFREPDLKFVISTGEAIAPHLRAGQLIVLESTTWPGTTTEVLKPILEGGGLVSGGDFYLAYSPERESPGDNDFGTASIPKVVGGDGEVAARLAAVLYGQVVETIVPVSSAATAEAVKLTENIFRAVNIALVNELKLVYDRMGIDVWEVVDAAKTKPFGYMPFYPGPGLGGHCIPIDPFYLTWKAREYGLSTRFIELAGETLTIIELLEERGAAVEYYDPFVVEIPMTREHAPLAGRKTVTWSKETLASYDAAFICTDHDNVDYAELVANSRLVVDTRNATRNVLEHRERIVKA
jgi:UDP-N-acetyl-D-glucosamine dehydrogenase